MKKKKNLLADLLQDRLQNKIEFSNNELKIYSKNFSLSELANALKISPNSIVIFFLGEKKIVTKNQNISIELAKNFLDSKNIRLNFRKKSDIVKECIKEYLSFENNENSIKRSPVISVMGHIDHGKSSFLDSIMETNEQKKEEGGITQRINIYTTFFKKKKLTFLDTPGHNLFVKMRERSASLTDIVVLVIDVNEGLKNQTLEVIDHIHKNKTPAIVFLNNKKKEEIKEESLNSLMSELQKNYLNPIQWGGDTIVLTGKAINKEDCLEVLKTVYELSEVYEWKALSDSEATGIFLDSYVSSKEGIVNTIVVKNGKLKINDNLFTANNFGKVNRIKNFENFKNEIEVFPGDIVKVYGLGFQSEIGESFFVANKPDLKKKIEKLINNDVQNTMNFTQKKATSENEGGKEINFVLVSSCQSSLEALENLVKKMSNDSLNFNIVYSEVGEFNQKTFDICKITNSSILAFNIKIKDSEISEAKKKMIKIINNSIIYKIEDSIKILIRDSKDKKIVEKISGIAEVKEIFYSSSVNGNIAGCDIVSGLVKRGSKIDVFRKEEKIFTGEANSLQRNKSNAKELKKGQECGIVVNNFNDFIIGDKIVFYSTFKEEYE